MLKSHASNFAVAAAILTPLAPSAAFVATADQGVAVIATETYDDIVVTARKREESSLSVPVSITALDQKTLAKYGTRDLQTLASQIPGLAINPSSSSAAISLRGITTAGQNPSGDQAVSINIDGVQVGAVNIIRFAQIDLQQVEVLKGPQTLFFGKNSTAGILSIRSADAGDEVEVKASGGYEFGANERYGLVVVSTPIGNDAGFRGVIYGSKRDGWLKLVAQPIPGISLGAQGPRGPKDEQIFARATFTANPIPDLKIRSKYSYGHLKGDDPFATVDRFACPNGAPQNLGLPLSYDCKLDGKSVAARTNPVLISNSPLAYLFKRQGISSTQHMGSLDLSYDVSDGVSFVSVSGLYSLKEAYRPNITYAPTSLIAGGPSISRREISQEVRLTTSKPEWPVNFMVGGYFQDTNFSQLLPLIIDSYVVSRSLPLGTPLSSNLSLYHVNSSARSVFGQLTVNPFSDIEVTAGARHSWEDRRLRSSLNGREVPGPRDHISFKDTSPEVTVSWKPTNRATVYGSYKRGFKSGGFNTGGQLVGVDLSYKPESAQGFEGGAKAEFNTVRLNGAVYSYRYKGLQVSGFDPARVANTVYNAGGARTRGVEVSASWRPQFISGFNLHGAVNYSDARYQDFLAPCYVGQTIAQGCAFTPSLAGRFQQQNLRGKQTLVAPDWTGSAGSSYDFAVDGNNRLSLSVDATFSSRFEPILEQAPSAGQKGYMFLNASARLMHDNDAWEIALVGQNLTNVYRSFYAAQVTFTGNSALTGTSTAGGNADILGQISRGRQVSLQATVRFK